MPENEETVVEVDETSWDATTPETTEATAETATDAATSPVDEAEGDEGTKIPVTDDDPWANYRDPATGLINGRFKTPAEAIEAQANADRAIAQKAFELQQAQARLAQYEGTNAADPTFDPMGDLAPLLTVPATRLLYNERFIRYGESKGVEWEADEDGIVDPSSAINAANITIVRDFAKEEVTTAKAAVAQAEEAAQHAEQQFYAAYPNLVGWEADVQKVYADLDAGHQFGPDFVRNSALLAERAQAVITQRAAALLGQRGGQATAKAAVSPVGGTSRGGGGGAAVKDPSEW